MVSAIDRVFYFTFFRKELKNGNWKEKIKTSKII